MAEALERLSVLSPQLLSRAREVAVSLLVPSKPPISVSTVRWYLHRALRNGSWARLSRLQRALLLVASKTVKTVKSQALVEVLKEIFLEVELATARGKAVLAAIVHLLSKTPHLLSTLVKRGLDMLVALGLQLLNHPLLGSQRL